MTKEELGKLYPLFLEPYNPQWPCLFENEKRVLSGFFSENLRIEHIGSTAIVGMPAKPTIDILMEQPETAVPRDIIKTMEMNGYIHMKEQEKHLMFAKGYTPEGLGKESFHVHMGPLSQGWLWDRVYFRDYLNANPGEAGEYEKLKGELSLRFTLDREAYTEGKADYVRRITEKAKKVENNDLPENS